MTKRNSKPPTLVEYAETYLAERDVCPMYAMHVRMACRKLCEFAGRVLRINQADCDTVNKWLVSLLDSGLSPYSVSTYRNDVLAVLNAAYMDRLIAEPPLRLRKIKKPRLLVECYTHAEIQQLLAAAAGLVGYDRNGNRRADFWQAVVHAAYSTGLRRGDLLAIPKSAIAGDGLYTTVQRKTGFPITVRFSADTLQHAAKLQSPRGLLIDWPYNLDSLTLAFRRVRNHAGIARGSLRWLRRAAGSYAEAVLPGAGARLLGHRDPGVFKRHYEDASITGIKPVEPPPVPPPADGRGAA